MAGFSQSQRSPSPPASAYFPMLSSDPNASLQPTAGADAHFAYSTTFRRHQVENSLASPHDFAAGAQSLWSKVLHTVAGQPSNEDHHELTPLPRQPDRATNTASEKFAHISAGVRTTHLTFR
jgi:P-type Ca2+ transporter type 2C